MPSAEELEAPKALVSEKYLGKAGIHGVGLRRSKSAVTLYVDPAAQSDQEERQKTLRSIEDDIKPIKVIVVDEGRASIT